MTKQEMTVLGESIQTLMRNLNQQYEMVICLAGILADEIDRQPHDERNQHTASFLRMIISQDTAQA